MASAKGEKFSRITRRGFLAALAVIATPRGAWGEGVVLPPLVGAVVGRFVAEALAGGGVDRARSDWQKPGRGAAVGGKVFEGGIDPRYLRFEIEALYRIGKRVGDGRLAEVADAQVGYLANTINRAHPTWAIGNALEAIGLCGEHLGKAAGLDGARVELIAAARARAVDVVTLDGVKFRHFPCGYGVLGAKDAGWTNDLSMLGSGLVRAYEATRDASILAEATSFAEYFVQPWRAKALGADGYWRCGTWHEGMGSWVIGPSHYRGFESVDIAADEASWVFSTVTCIDFLMRLYRHQPDPRYLDRCRRAAEWTFRSCQFEDGAVGMCGRDDKWLGFTGDAITQVELVRPHLKEGDEALAGLLRGAQSARRYLEGQLASAKLKDHGVEWVQRKTSIDPLVNVAMLWGSALLGWLDALDLPEAPA